MLRVCLHAVCRCLIALLFGYPAVRSACRSQCMVVANHNSHLDTVMLLRLFPLSLINRVKVVAAGDYFSHGLGGMAGKALFNMLLLDRRAKNAANAMEPLHQALREGYSLVLFPEGTRGKPGELQEFKGGIGKLAMEFPDIPVYPVCIHGVEKSLPRGGVIPVPFAIRLELLDPVFGRDYAALGSSQGRKALSATLEQSIRTALDRNRPTATE